jgi:hypothetical protein
MLPCIIGGLNVMTMVCQGCPVRAAWLEGLIFDRPLIWSCRNVLYHHILWMESPVITEHFCKVAKWLGCLRLFT